MTKKQKNVSVSLSPSAEKPKSYELFLVKTTESSLQIHFAAAKETANDVKINISEIIEIPSHMMKHFAVSIIDALVDYEKEHQNGLGFDFSPHEGQSDK